MYLCVCVRGVCECVNVCERVLSVVCVCGECGESVSACVRARVCGRVCVRASARVRVRACAWVSCVANNFGYNKPDPECKLP